MTRLTQADMTRAPDLPLTPGCTVTLRNGEVRGEWVWRKARIGGVG